MRRLVAALSLGLATGLSAQTSAAKPKSSSYELRVGGFMINGERSYNFFNNVNTETGSTKGIEFLLRAKAGGISFRSLSGTFGTQPQVISADARLLLFPQVFTIFAGAARRALYTELNTQVFDLGVGGVSSTVAIGGSGLRTHISAAVLVPAGGESKDLIKGGLEGEANILYTIPKIPVFLQIGYRTELFTAQANDENTGMHFETPEEVRGIRFGGGIQFGGR